MIASISRASAQKATKAASALTPPSSCGGILTVRCRKMPSIDRWRSPSTTKWSGRSSDPRRCPSCRKRVTPVVTRTWRQRQPRGSDAVGEGRLVVTVAVDAVVHAPELTALQDASRDAQPPAPAARLNGRVQEVVGNGVHAAMRSHETARHRRTSCGTCARAAVDDRGPSCARRAVRGTVRRREAGHHPTRHSRRGAAGQVLRRREHVLTHRSGGGEAGRALSSGGGGGRRARASRRRRRRRRPSGTRRGRGSRGGAYAGRCRGEVDAGSLGHLVGDPVRVAEGAGLGRGVGPRGGEDDDAGEVVDPDHQDQRDAEGLERLGVGRGLEQEGGELLEDLEHDGPQERSRTTATGWGCSAARAGGRRRRRAACWPPGPGTGPAPRGSPPRPRPGRAPP